MLGLDELIINWLPLQYIYDEDNLLNVSEMFKQHLYSINLISPCINKTSLFG